MRRGNSSGSIVLVALSCVAVLGIATVAFLAVSNPSMRLSNRAYAKIVSKNLAEAGIERALRSFNAGNFLSSGWTVNSATATANLTFSIPSSRYVTSNITTSNITTSNITTSVKVRVDHYRDTQKATIWKERTSYAADDYVWFQGVWYLCTNSPPAIPQPPNSYWTSEAAWNSATSYGTVGTFVVLGGATVYCSLTTPNSNRNPSTNATYWLAYNAPAWDSTKIYVVGDVVSSGGAFYRCILIQDPSNTAYWKSAPENWSPYANYRIGNIALSGGSAYRCIVSHIGQAPPNATYWTAASAVAWDGTTVYNVDDIVFSGGVPYRCRAVHTPPQKPPNTTYWISAPVIFAEGVVNLPEGRNPNGSGGTDIKTQLRVMLAPAPLFPNALGASSDVVMASTGSIDSYNSVLGTYNQTTAPFSVGSPNTGSSAVVAGGDTASTAVAIGNMRIRGYVAAPSASSSPYAPLTSNSSSGIVTDTATGTPTTKIDLTRVSRSPYIPQFDIQSVTGAGVLPNGTTVLDDNATVLGTPGATTPAKYSITGTYDSGTSILRSGLYLEDSADIVSIIGPVILSVSGTVYTNTGKIVILPGGSLEIRFTGQLWIGSSTSSGIQNLTYNPKRCILVGTSTANSAGDHYYWTTMPQTFTTLYMPNAYVRTWSNVPFYGAISAKNIGFPNAGVAFHYDTSLRTAGAIATCVDSPYLTTEVRELTDATERITLP